MDVRQDAAVTRRQGCLRYGGVVDSWIDELFVAANYLIEPSIYREDERENSVGG